MVDGEAQQRLEREDVPPNASAPAPPNLKGRTASMSTGESYCQASSSPWLVQFTGYCDLTGSYSSEPSKRKRSTINQAKGREKPRAKRATVKMASKTGMCLES